MPRNGGAAAAVLGDALSIELLGYLDVLVRLIELAHVVEHPQEIEDISNPASMEIVRFEAVPRLRHWARLSARGSGRGNHLYAGSAIDPVNIRDPTALLTVTTWSTNATTPPVIFGDTTHFSNGSDVIRARLLAP